MEVEGVLNPASARGRDGQLYLFPRLVARAHYRGTLLNGTEFDASYNRGQPLVWQMNQVVRGWTEGLQLMAVGSKYKFYIPYELGYGAMGNGQTIPGGSMLIFDLELIDVKKKQ